ncbi:type III secretion system stalk subunit SctO [Thiofilum flexile]|uniref:type III secretion system stalk subunit SctO n=1 Tax=Thiofilum flexile TaxID=125627 RepID=UPI00035C23E5|nr:YscO family type III secretion system apparatus protein [Thiofilum flexile]
MSLNDLKELKKIRNRRMEQQLAEMQEKRRQVDGYTQQLQQAKNDLSDYQHWRLQQQETRFKALQSQPFTPEALREYQGQLENMLMQEQFYYQAISAAENQLKASEAAWQESKQKSDQMTLQYEKMKEIVEIEAKAVALAKSEDRAPDP